MKKWKIIQIILIAIMLATSIGDVWVENCTWDLVLEISYVTALFLVCVTVGIIHCIQQKELRRLADEYVGRNYPWVSITDKLPEDGLLAKGFTEKQPIGVKLMLIVSELSEALEADRKNKHADFDCFGKVYDCGMEDLKGFDSPNKEAAAYAAAFRCSIKDTFEDEIADAFLRLMDLCGEYNIDIETHIKMKSEYNKLRPVKHGKEY